jgi:hypothetical protein
MRGADGGRGVLRAALLAVPVALAVVLAACGAPEPEPTAVPTFPSAGQHSGPSANPGSEGGAIPDDCSQILTTGDLEALLGLPLGSVGVRTTIGVAAPSVGRTERVACAYTSGSRPLLELNASVYADREAAAEQWRVNADAESGDRRLVPLGSASAVLVERNGEAVLMVAHGASNLTAVLPDQPLPGGRNRADVLVDLALRVLPTVASVPAASSRTGPPASTTTTASHTAGTVS